MLQNIKELYGNKLAASDGEIGHVSDFYFDDKTWAIRYLVVDTGSWLSGRHVLLSPHAFDKGALGKFDVSISNLRVNLTRKQIEDSPSTDLHRPISRQYEEDYYRFYGWPTYWDANAFGGMLEIVPPPTPENRQHLGRNQRDDIHLRSTKSVTGYHIHATDGQIGSVSSFMVHGHSWAIRELVVETGHWYAGKSILILTENVSRISYEDSAVYVNLAKDDLAKTFTDDVAHIGGSHC